LKKKEAADWTVNRIFLNKTSVEEILIRMIKQYEKTEEFYGTGSDGDSGKILGENGTRRKSQ